MEQEDAKHKIAELTELFQRLEELRGQAKTLDTFRVHQDMARRGEEYLVGFRQRLADIFQDPEAAYQKFAALALSKGVDAASENMLKNPDDYGVLKGWSFGPLNNPARAGILKLSLPAAARTATEGFNAHLRTGGGGLSRDELAQKTKAAREKFAQAEIDFGSTGRRIELELQIAEKAREISFRDLAALPKDQYRQIENLRDKYRNLIQSNDGDIGKRLAAAKRK